MIKNLFVALFLLLFVLPLFAMADPFFDVPQGHWAYDAVNMLQEKGLVEGYPDGLFKGDRPMTRYEMAMVVARVVAKLEQIKASVPQMPDLSIYATKEDLETINRLLNEFHGELDALGVRVTNIEDSLAQITERVDNLEKVFVAGDITVVASSVGFSDGFPTDPNAPPIFENYGGYLLTHGQAVTSRLNLDIGVNISEDVVAGGTLVGYSAFGDPGVAYAWGVLPPYNEVGFSANQIYNNGINYQANLNKLWFKTKGDWEVNGTFGEYLPEKLSPLVYYGIITPAYWAGDRLPINGIDLKGSLYGKYKYEMLEANDITWVDYGPSPVYFGNNPFDLWASDFYQNNGYHNRMYATLGGYQDDKLDFDATYMRIYEDAASNPSRLLDPLTAPKDEIILGFRGSYKIYEDKLRFFGELNHSWFGSNLVNSVQPREGGNAFIFGEEGNWNNLNYKAQFIRIDGNYEPFNFRQIFEYKYTACCSIGEGVYVPSLYRPNRTGFDIHGNYKFDEDKGNIFGGLTFLRQIDPTFSANPETTIGSRFGFQDHSFFNDSTEKGRELFYDIGANYQITDKWYIEGHFFSYNFNRDYLTYEHDQTRRYLHIAGSYNVTDELKITGLYEMATINGIDDFDVNTDAILHIPGVSLSYNFSEDTSVGIDYRVYKFNDNLDSNNDYRANRVSTWMKVNF